MAVIFSTDFEGYADGEQSLLDNGWTGPVVAGVGERCAVVSFNARGGTKCVQFGDDLTPPVIDTPQALRRAVSPSGSSVSISAWSRKPLADASGCNITVFHSALFGSGILLAQSASIDAGAGVRLYGADGAALGEVAGVVPVSAYYQSRLRVHMSTVNATLDGVNADGCLTVEIDGSPVIVMTGLSVYVTNTGWAAGLNHAPDRVQLSGEMWLDDVSIDDDAIDCPTDPAEPGTPPTNGSTPCCGSESDPPLGPNPGDPPTYPPLQPWDRGCAGGGAVFAADDVVDVEAWTL